MIDRALACDRRAGLAEIGQGIEETVGESHVVFQDERAAMPRFDDVPIDLVVRQRTADFRSGQALPQVAKHRYLIDLGVQPFGVDLPGVHRIDKGEVDAKARELL